MAVATRTTRPVELMLADELMFALSEMTRLAGGWENACDELINCSFTDCEAPRRRGVSAEPLAAARDRLSAAGAAWAQAVTASFPIERTRLDAALDRIGHQGSSAFRDRLAGAYAQVA